MKSLSKGDEPQYLKCFHFESPSHTGALLNGLSGLRQHGFLLDVTLIVGLQHFPAHRVVLASCSEYFRAMFTDGLKESQLMEIYLQGVPAEGMRYLLEYIYTSRLSINLANIQDILAAANHVQMISVVEACSRYLQEQLDLENCVDIVNIAETYCLHQLRKHAYQFMCSCLHHFSQTPDFQHLSPCQLEHLLKCDFPVDCDESQVLRIVTAWLEFNLEERTQHARQLLSSIHFEEIPSPKIVEFTKSHIFHAIFSTVTFQLQKRLHNSNCHLGSCSQLQSTLVNSRGMELAIVKVGGFGIGGITNDITHYLPSQGKWCHLTSIPHVEQCNYGTAVLNNELYVVGGCFNQGGSFVENIHPFGFRFNPRYNRWTTIAPLQQERCKFSLCAVAGELYAVGGLSEGTEDDSDCTPCEKYDPHADMWLLTSAPLPGHRTQHAGATWRDSLFISGGLDQETVLNSIYRYDVFEDKWEKRADMLLPRADHSMVVYKDKLYVCGGWYEDEATSNRVIVDTIDAYDILENKWETVSRIPTPRYHASAVIIQDVLYMVGGFHSDVTFDRATGVIECFSFERRTWTTVNCYPQDIWEHCCVSLYIPKCRDDMEVVNDVT